MNAFRNSVGPKGIFRSASVLLVLAMLSTGLATTTAQATVIFVNASTTGTGNGTTWANAYTDLQSALAVANDITDSVGSTGTS